MKEIYKNVTLPEFSDLYMVSNLGNVMSLHRKNYGGILKTVLSRGYKILMLKNKKIKKSISVHRLVALAFIPNPQNKDQIDHIDGDKTNNCVDNLRWVTAYENTHNPITESKVKATKKWVTFEACEEESKKYTSRADFWRHSASAYRQAVKNKWIDKFSWLIPQAKEKGYWTYEKCREEALKFETFADFEEKSTTAYQKSRKYGWIKSFTWLKARKRKPKLKKWNFLNCLKEAEKYSTKRDFIKYSNTAYQLSARRKWLSMFYWLG